MATRKQKMSFAVKRFKGFWNQFRRSKRGLVGLGIILVFSIIAIFAPLIAPYKPIDPQMGIGQYPAFGPTAGIQIAEELAKPVWYKYLPWIARGATQLTESFYNVVTYYPQLGITVQTFAHEGIENASDSALLLTQRVANITKVSAFYDNQEHELVRTVQWDVNPRYPREVKINDIYENGTKFDVMYVTGIDLVENTEVESDHTFSSSQTFNQWNWTTNYPDLVTVSYTSTKGFAFRPEDNHGAIQISYEPGVSAPSQPIEVTVSRTFTYPYHSPPVSFFIHTSIQVDGITPIDFKMLFFKEGESTPYLIAERTQKANATYSHVYFTSYDPKIAEKVGTTPPQDRIFASPGNYRLAIQLTLPPEAIGRNIYLDNVNAVMYGNIFGLMGTDNGIPFPRDLFSLLVYGSRVSLLVGVLSALFSTLIGLFLGLISGYMGGLADEGIMRFADLLLVLPTLPLFIVLVVALRQVSGYVSMWNIIIILTLFGWMSFARSVRSMVLSIRERAFIEAARAAGAGKLHIINRHIIPNVFALVYITLATSVPGAIITEASLSWLGLGDPMLPSWGKILYDFNSSSIALAKGMTEYWFWIFPACIAIALLATAFILVGYALDEILNPRLRERR